MHRLSYHRETRCYLTEEDRLAIAEYLKSVVTPQPRHVREMQAGQPALKRGAQVYANVCVACHLNGEAGAPSFDEFRDG